MKVSGLRNIKTYIIFYYCRNNAQQGLRMPNKVWAIVGRCNMCARDVETDQGWYCRFCANFHVCNSCYKKELVFNHPHKLTTQNDNARQEAEQKVCRSLICYVLFAIVCFYLGILATEGFFELDF